MKLLSFNYTGLASPSKKSSLKRLVDTMGLDIIFLQETMGNSQMVKYTPETLLMGLIFEAVDARDRSGGLATRWHLRSCRCDHVWGVEFRMGLEVCVEELVRT